MSFEPVKTAARLGLDADRCNVKMHVLNIMRYAKVDMMHLDLLGEIARDMKEAIDAIFGCSPDGICSPAGLVRCPCEA